MQHKISDLFRLLLPLSKEKKANLNALKEFLDVDEFKYATYLLKLKRIGISYKSFDISKKFVKNQAYPQVFKSENDPHLTKVLTPWNEKIRKKSLEKAYQEFSHDAHEHIYSLIAPQIIGFEEVKKAATWQLFCTHQLHILLLGDPATGKTEILRSAAKLAPISSFGLGSGVSGVGLCAAKKGKEVVKGLLPLAHNGLCCIDELNLMKRKDRGALLNAMEKGFVTYDKASHHLKFPAKIRLLATANPKGDRFIGSKIRFLKQQLPFDPALLSRFHIIFLSRRPSSKELVRITKAILNQKDLALSPNDVDFVKGYISYAKKITVDFDKNLEPVISDFMEDLKDNEDNFLIELSPRMVLGIVRITKAIARTNLRSKVTHDDLVKALKMIKNSLYIEEDARKVRTQKTKTKAKKVKTKS